MADAMEMLEMLIPPDEPLPAERYFWATVTGSNPTTVRYDGDEAGVVSTPNVIPGVGVGVGTRVLILKKGSRAFVIGGGSDGSDNLLWSGNVYMNASQTAQLSQRVADQATGIVLAFSRYVSGTTSNDSWSYFFVPKSHVLRHSGGGIGFLIPHGTSNASSNKYIYVHEDRLTGNAINSTAPGNFSVLRYVFGV